MQASLSWNVMNVLGIWYSDYFIDKITQKQKEVFQQLTFLCQTPGLKKIRIFKWLSKSKVYVSKEINA